MNYLVKVEKKLNKVKIAVIMIIIINISVLLGALYVNKHYEEVNRRYVAINNKLIMKEISEKMATVNLNFKEAKIEYDKQKIIKYSQDTQNKINNITRNKEQKVVYLTFDDGPSKTVTPQILDILKQNDVKATFFVLGQMVTYYPDVVKRTYDEGHYIANHGYSHVYSQIYGNKEAFLEEIKKTDALVGKAIQKENYKSYLVRFPGGSTGGKYAGIKKEIKTYLNENEYAYVDWNCLTKDSEGKFTKEQLVQNFKETAGQKNALIILMHDAGNKQTTVEALSEIIPYLKEQGYQFENFYNIM